MATFYRKTQKLSEVAASMAMETKAAWNIWFVIATVTSMSAFIILCTKEKESLITQVLIEIRLRKVMKNLDIIHRYLIALNSYTLNSASIV